MLLVGGIVIVAAVVAALLANSGSGGGKHPASSTHSKLPAVSSIATLAVTVLNGTETEGLAHHFAAQLRSKGYTHAAALQGRPPGTNEESTVEYATGERTAAERVAHAISVSHVAPLEGGVAPLGAGAQVVVIIGANAAATSP